MHKKRYFRLSVAYDGDKADRSKRDGSGFKGFIDEYGSPRKPRKEVIHGKNSTVETFYFESKAKGKKFIKNHNLHPEVSSRKSDGTKKAYAKHFWWE